MSRNLFERHYAQIEQLLGRPLDGLRPGEALRLRAAGLMDLVVEVLPPWMDTAGTVLSLAHYFLQNGDLCQDPEMTVRLLHPGSRACLELVPSTDPVLGRAEALTFQQAIPPIFQQVYPEPGVCRPQLQWELNEFLGLWLENLRAQGHKPEPRNLAAS